MPECAVPHAQASPTQLGYSSRPSNDTLADAPANRAAGIERCNKGRRMGSATPAPRQLRRLRSRSTCTEFGIHPWPPLTNKLELEWLRTCPYTGAIRQYLAVI